MPSLECRYTAPRISWTRITALAALGGLRRGRWRYSHRRCWAASPCSWICPWRFPPHTPPLGQIFFCLTASLAFFTSPGWHWDEAKLEDTSTPSLQLSYQDHHRRHPGTIDSGRRVSPFQRGHHHSARGGRLRGNAAGGLGGFHGPDALRQTTRLAAARADCWGDCWWRNFSSASARTL